MKSVEQILKGFNAHHVSLGHSNIGGPIKSKPDTVPMQPDRPMTEPKSEQKVTCPGCNAQYGKRAKWVKEGRERCYRCTKAAAL